jgi:hypothetical protein
MIHAMEQSVNSRREYSNNFLKLLPSPKGDFNGMLSQPDGLPYDA